MKKGRIAAGLLFATLGTIGLVSCDDDDTSGGGGGQDVNESMPDLGASMT